MLRHWHRLPRDVVDSQEMEVFKNHGDVLSRHMVRGHGGNGLVLGSGILQVFQPSLACDFMIHSDLVPLER